MQKIIRLKITEVILFVFCTLCSFASAKTVDKPNVVIILSDDQHWSDYGFMGHEHIQTPSLDELARDGVLFKRGYVPTALCRPSLLTIATGLYARDHGVTGNDPSSTVYGDKKSKGYRKQRQALIDKIKKVDTLPELLAKQGYVSFQSGKWWEGHYEMGGFTDGMTLGFPNPKGRHGDIGLNIGRKGMSEVTDFMDKAVKDKKPFFVWYAPFLPHTPHTPPKALESKYKGASGSEHIDRYYAMCEWFDQTCGQLLDHLDQLNIKEDTLVVYVTDNGWINDPTKASFMAGSKQSPNEGGVRTPIIFSWPGQLKAQVRSENVSSIDIMPTVLAAAGAPIPKNLPGKNILAAMKHGTPIQRDYLYGESFAHDIADIDEPDTSLLYRWVMAGPWKLIRTYDGKFGRYASRHGNRARGPQLFHIDTDPYEKNNLADAYPDKVKALEAALNAWYKPKTKTL